MEESEVEAMSNTTEVESTEVKTVRAEECQPIPELVANQTAAVNKQKEESDLDDEEESVDKESVEEAESIVVPSVNQSGADRIKLSIYLRYDENPDLSANGVPQEEASNAPPMEPELKTDDITPETNGNHEIADIKENLDEVTETTPTEMSQKSLNDQLDPLPQMAEHTQSLSKDLPMVNDDVIENATIDMIIRNIDENTIEAVTFGSDTEDFDDGDCETEEANIFLVQDYSWNEDMEFGYYDQFYLEHYWQSLNPERRPSIYPVLPIRREDEMMYYCHQDSCEEESNSWDTHKEHLLMHKKAEVFGDVDPAADPSTFLCEVCFKVFKMEDEFKLHNLFHKRNLNLQSKKRFICDVCGKGYADKPGVKKHMKQVHPYYNEQDYIKYMQFLPAAARPFQCRLCSKVVKTKHKIVVHIQNKHLFKNEEVEKKDGGITSKSINGEENGSGDENSIEDGSSSDNTETENDETENELFEDEDDNKGLGLDSANSQTDESDESSDDDSTDSEAGSRRRRRHRRRRDSTSSSSDSDEEYGKKQVKNVDEYAIATAEDLLLNATLDNIETQIKKYELDAYHCAVCLKIFQKKTVVNTHLIRMHYPHLAQPKQFSCTICTKSYSTKDYLKKHMKVKHDMVLPPSMYKKHAQGSDCPICGKSYSSRKYMLRHKRTQHNKSPSKILVQGTNAVPETVTVSELESLIKTCTDSTIPFQCSLCTRSFGSRHKVRLHLLSQHYPGAVVDCNNTISSKDGENATDAPLIDIGPSIEDSTGTESTKFQCKVCLKVYSHRTLIEKHAAKEHPNVHDPWVMISEEDITNDADCDGKFKWKCNVCDKIYAYREGFYHHAARAHPDEKDVCTILPIENADAINENKDNENTRYQCRVCRKVFVSRKFLYKHAMKMHPDEEDPCKVLSAGDVDSMESMRQGVKFRCRICLKEYTFKTSFDKHIEKEHPNEQDCVIIIPAEEAASLRTESTFILEDSRPLPNDNESVTEKSENAKEIDIDAYIRKCEEGSMRPFQCGLCAGFFNSEPETRRHIRRQHFPSEKTYSCPFCPKKFAKHTGLTYHVTYKHSQCESGMNGDNSVENGMTTANDIESHIKEIEGASPFQCALCSKSYTAKSTVRTHLLSIHFSGPKMDSFGKTNEPCVPVNEDSASCKIEDLPKLKLDETVGSPTTEISPLESPGIIDITCYIVICDEGDVSPFQCGICCTYFSKRQGVKRHILTQHFPDICPYKCTICPQKFSRRDKLKDHMIKEHGVTPPVLPKSASKEKIAEGTCDKKESYDAQHSTIEPGELVPVSLNSFGSPNKKLKLDSAQYVSYSSPIKKLKLDNIVSLSSTDNSPLKSPEVDVIDVNSHIKIDEAEGRPPTYQCDICEKFFADKKGVRRHILSTHCPAQFACTICDQKFGRSDKLRYHLSTKHGIRSPMKSMSEVQKTPVEKSIDNEFPATMVVDDDAVKVNMGDDSVKPCSPNPNVDTLETSTSMISINHDNEPPSTPSTIQAGNKSTKGSEYKCTKCRKKFVYATGLQRHMKKDHPDAFKAFLSSKEVDSPVKVKVDVKHESNGDESHKNTTNGDTPNKLEVKPVQRASFSNIAGIPNPPDMSTNNGLCSQSSVKAKQKQQVYKNSSPNVAKKESREIENLIKVCEETPPRYQCTVCDKSYSTRGNVKSHLVTKHFPNMKLKEYYCNYCSTVFTRKDKCDEHQKICKHVSPQKRALAKAVSELAVSRTFNLHNGDSDNDSCGFSGPNLSDMGNSETDRDENGRDWEPSEDIVYVEPSEDIVYVQPSEDAVMINSSEMDDSVIDRTRAEDIVVVVPSSDLDFSTVDTKSTDSSGIGECLTKSQTEVAHSPTH